jgi:hypothetical protein
MDETMLFGGKELRCAMIKRETRRSGDTGSFRVLRG